MKAPVIALCMLVTHVLCEALQIDMLRTIACVACVGVAVAEMRGKR